ncbi:MAG: prolipoprotein diacylglyceryl transferase [Verrucomicrobiota bacterium]
MQENNAYLPIAPDSEGYWVHTLSEILIPFPEGFPIDGIRYYGLSYLLGFWIAWLLLKLLYKQDVSPLNADQRADLSLYMIIGVMAGGRLGYMLLYSFGSLLNDPLSLFQVWKGGMASHGGFIGVVVAMAIYAKRARVSFLKLTDLCVLICTPGIILGRIANFINGELWGHPSRVPWAVIFPESELAYVAEFSGNFLVPRHPSQLYQAGLEGVLVGVFLWWRLSQLKTKIRAGRLSGLLGAEFLMAYGSMRVVGEWFRVPDEGLSMIFGILSRGTFYSILMIGIGAVIWRWIKKRDADAVSA